MGPLADIKVIELAGIGPGPMCGMLLADLGATVLRIDREQPVELGNPRPLKFDLLLRNRKSIALDLKEPMAVELVLDLVSQADALIESYRPGVAERLGLGPAQCIERNPRLVYGRITGFGQDGPLAKVAAHEINNIALTGALYAIGRKGSPPTAPLNLLGDYAGGALYLAIGILSAVLEARASGEGQVVDASIVDGTLSQMTSFFGRYAGDMISLERGANSHDSGAYYYDVYECADGRWVSVAPIEKRFRDEFFRLMGFSDAEIGNPYAKQNDLRLRTLLSERFKTRSAAEWCDLLENTDACFAPVLTLAEAPEHVHLRARGTFVEIDGIVQPAPAPRFSRTVPDKPHPPQPPNATQALKGWKTQCQIEQLKELGVVK